MKLSPSEKYFRRFLRISPLSVAAWRTVEAKYLSRVKFKKPILDLGCGFGEFAQAFVEDQIDLGVDIKAKDLFAAAKTKKYKSLLFADARNLPFPDNTFSTIISISTFEHIKNTKKLLKECYRVLKPDGLLIATIETDLVDENSFYRPFLKRIGLNNISNFLTKSYNNFFFRYILLSSEKWINYLKEHGFEIKQFENIISPRVVKIYDIFIITSWPSQIFKAFFGRRIVYRPKVAEDILVRLFMKYIDEEKEGTNLFVVARKPRK
ncbi:MAG: class I SAM-dependent methyltransferase [Patescibacteria group bacterium]|nr:class I SAM-dependent methyltransferase [Patescibacteria group bacterium]